MIWNMIEELLWRIPAPNPYNAYLTKNPVAFIVQGKPENRHWVIGPYKGLKDLAGHLRVDPTKRASFSRACFGRRHTDLPPTGPQPSGGFRKAMAVAVPHPIDPALIGKRQVDLNPTPRRSDLYDAFADFYSKKTLEAHHIVEKKILDVIGRNKGDLSDDRAPSVLVVAKLHQQIYTPEVAKDRASFSPGMSSQQQADKLTDIYTKVYVSTQMADLLAIANIIIGQVRLGLPI
jgi:hypothetical protein